MIARSVVFVVLIICFILPIEHIKATSPIQIIIDSELQHFNQAPFINNGTTFVPMREIFETLGATVTWDDPTKTVTAKKGDTSIEITIDSSTAIVNGLKISISQPAHIHNDFTLVPLRFVSTALGAKVEWDDDTRTVHITTVHENHQKTPLLFHLSEQQLLATFGEPILRLKSQYSFEWLVYHDNYQNYFQVGIKDGKIVALYAYKEAIERRLQLQLGKTKEEIEDAIGDSLSYIVKEKRKFQYDTKDEWGLYETEDYYYTVFYDIHNENNVNAIQIIKKSIEHSLIGFYGTGTTTLAQSFEKQLIALTNAARKQQGLPILTVDSIISTTARNHSTDMATYRYFSHTNLAGESPFVRMERDGISFYTAGENIAMGQMSAIFAHEALMNSIGHRNNILNESYEKIGVGVFFAGDIPYYTQNFYK